MEQFDLNGNWKFKARPAGTRTVSEKREVYEWMPATVPGTVHTDLLENGKIPDPFFRMNELDVQWVEREGWIYQREFIASQEFIDDDDVDLVVEGVDTFARITLNGKRVGETTDMFVEHRFSVKKLLKAGSNVLEIALDSPALRTKQLEHEFGALQVSHEPPRVYARKAQYSFGWDWGPKLTTSGIWRPIILEAYSHCRIKSVFARAVKITKQRADVQVDVDLERLVQSPVELTVEVTGFGFEYKGTFKVRRDKKSVKVEVPHPRLWWPNGWGDQAMYRVEVSVESGGIHRDTKSAPFGIRTVRLLQEKDDQGRSFILEVNGGKIYCKGADWIPSDNFIPRIPISTYERLLTMAHDANMNMVRVWGGGIYEQDVFYELCDRLGLMVWQDFMFACGEYPEERWFLDLVRDEARKAVTRLRNHPSLVLWCGNNECEWIFCKENPDKTPDQMNGAPIFRDILPSACHSLDGSRPYWRSSPFGTGFPNDESNGNHHQWEMWGFWKDFRFYEQDFARFVTEFGFQAPAALKTMERVTLPDDRFPQSRVFEHHNKLPDGTERLYRFQASHYRIGADLEEFIYLGQLVQAEALKTAVEHWRRRKFGTAGSMFWQLNDCWPVTSWSVIDSALRPKAAYYFARKFFSPVLVSFKCTPTAIEVWGTNDRRSAVEGDLDIHVRAFDDANLRNQREHVVVAANSSKLLKRIRAAEVAGTDPIQSYLHAQLVVSGELVSENRFYFTEPKHMNGKRAKLRWELSKIDEQTYELSIGSKNLAKNVRLEVEDADAAFEDNYFDIDAGSVRKIKVTTEIPVKRLRKKLNVRSLWD